MTTATKNEIDWKAAEAAAERLGVLTRELVAEKNADAVQDWALRLASECNSGHFNEPRAASYLELAVLVGHASPVPDRLPADDERLKWLKSKIASIDLQLRSVDTVVAAVEAETAANGDKSEESDEEVEISADDLPADFLDEQEEGRPDE